MTRNVEMTSYSNSRIGAVIVLFHPDTNSLTRTIESIIESVDTVSLINNTPDNKLGLADLSFSNQTFSKKIFINNLGFNSGIAHALNVGIETIINNGMAHCLLLDQDSTPEKTMVGALLKCQHALAKSNIKVGAVGPIIFDRLSDIEFGFPTRKPNDILYRIRKHRQTHPMEVVSLITSGTFFSIETYRSIGPFNEKLFIDLVDIEWCLRGRNKGFQYYSCRNAELNHSFGEDVIRYWLLGKRKINKYSPARLYYRHRNLILLFREKHTPLFWKIRASISLLVVLYAHTFFTRNGMQSMKLSLLGIIHGILKKEQSPFEEQLSPKNK